MHEQEQQSLVILDDGRYSIELHANSPRARAPGFLRRRCYVGVTTPEGYECLGSFAQEFGSGLWVAAINALYDEARDSDSRVVGRFPRRLDAIVALWGARGDAYQRHDD